MTRGRKTTAHMAASVFARKAAKYFRDCDLGAAVAACEKCETPFGDEKCLACSRKKARPYTVSGLCLALGVTKREFAAMKRDAAFAKAVEMAMLRIEAFIEENSITGTINGTLALAILREHFGWGEKTEAETVSVVLSEEASTLGK